jgi:hypothetical protein
MTIVAYNDNTRDWAADCNGEGQERAARDDRDSGVVMMAAAVEEGGGRQRWRRRTMTVADTNSIQDWAGDYKGDRQEWTARDGGDTEWR